MNIQLSPLSLSLLIFFSFFTLILAFISFLSLVKRKQKVLKRTEKLVQLIEPARNDFDNTDGDETGKKTLLGFLKQSAHKKNKDQDTGIYSDTPLFYQRAGIYNPASIRFYQFIRYVLLLTPIVLFIIYHILFQTLLRQKLLFGVFVVSYLGYFLPVLWLKCVAHYRRKKLDRTFPDAMDLLLVCIEAGIGIDAAIRRVAKEFHITNPELAKEFKILSLELKTGRPRNDCLRNLAKRTNLPDIDNLVSLLIQSERYGTGVANALRIHAEEMRKRRYHRLEEKAAKLPPKLVLPMVMFIFPALFVVIAGPMVIQVFRLILQR